MRVNGKALEVIRTRSGLSLRQLSQTSGVSFRYIRNIEQELHEPSWRIVQKLATALKISPITLLVDPSDANFAIPGDTQEIA